MLWLYIAYWERTRSRLGHKRSLYVVLWFSHVTYVLWSNFDVDLKNHGYYTIWHIFPWKKNQNYFKVRSKRSRSKSSVLKFWALAPGARDYRFSALKLSRNVLICMVKVCYDYIYRILRKGLGHGQVINFIICWQCDLVTWHLFYGPILTYNSKIMVIMPFDIFFSKRKTTLVQVQVKKGQLQIGFFLPDLELILIF